MLRNIIRDGWKYLVESNENMTSDSEVFIVNGDNVLRCHISELIDLVNSGQSFATELQPSSSTPQQNPIVRSMNVTATLSDLNQVGGKTIIDAVEGRSLRVVGFIANVTGNFTGLTSLVIKTAEESSETVATLPQGLLTDGATVLPLTGTVTLTKLGVDLGTVGLSLEKVGGLILTGTSVNLTVLYIEEIN